MKVKKINKNKQITINNKANDKASSGKVKYNKKTKDSKKKNPHKLNNKKKN